MSRPHVIVGANLAGGRAAEALRDAGSGGPVILVGEEPDRPYERPPLSKEVLRGEADAPFLRDAAWYDDHDIDLRLGVRVTALDPAAHTVTLDDGASIGYERCLLATGGRVRRLTVPGADLDGVHYLRTMRDARSLREALARTPRVVVVGAGFIGAEAAASARTVGCDVTMIEIADVPLGRVLGEDLGRLYAAIHSGAGVDLRLGEGVERFAGSGRVEAVVGSSGRRYDADAVVVGVGIEPNVELASEAGITCDDGIVVDEHCRTSAPDVYAAGDVARRPHAGGSIRVEHFQNAQNQGTAAGRNMAGDEQPFDEVPWFWSDQYDVNLQMLGHPSPAAVPVVRGNLDQRSFTAFWLDGGRVMSALALNRPRDVAVARRLIERRVAVEPSRLRDDDVPLRDLLR